MIHYVNTNQKKAGVPILISDKIDFRVKKRIKGHTYNNKRAS